jgi:hypothetical protein
MVSWTQDAFVRGVTSPKTGDLWQVYPGSRTGDHTPYALGAVAGPGIEASFVDELDSMRYAPTIARLLDVDVPGHVEGKAFV